MKCKYFSVCGTTENCKGCKGFEALEITPTKLALERARYIKSIIKTPVAGCYRRESIPRTATLQNIALIYMAMSANAPEESAKIYEQLKATKLYKEHGGVYCSLLALVRLSFFD